MATTASPPAVRTGTLDDTNNPLPLVIQPGEGGFTDAENLAGWIKENFNWLREKQVEHGAVLFRGFQLVNEEDFETVALAFEPDLKNQYQGTSPRNQRSKYVFNASELPEHYPIMQHCEMSFLESAPRRLFFFCKIAPAYGGETPICDFRKVYNDLDPEVRDAFEQRGIRYIRNYAGPDEKKLLNVFQLKPWPEIYNTTDKSEAEQKIKDSNLRWEWKKNDGLRLVNELPAVKTHPETGEKVWFNHLQVFHSEAAAIEYKHIHRYQGRMKTWWVSNLLKGLTAYQRATTQPQDFSMHCQFGDGGKVPRRYVEHVEAIIWKHLRIFPWQQGDLLAIDNFSTSHGRLPYKGDREILVAWSG